MNWLLIGGWIFVIVWVAVVIATNKKIHPKALFALFMVELWERFSYYGMRAILIFYMTYQLVEGGLAYDDASAYGIYGAYGALVYLTPIIGGYFADKMMGFRKAIIWGALVMAAGQFVLFLNSPTLFFVGLALLVIGNGFFKPNISSMIGRFYEEGDPRRDGAFTIFYMGINMGAFVAPLTCTAVGAEFGWKYGFLTAGLGMMVGYLVFMYSQKVGWLEQYGLKPELEKPIKIAGLGDSILPYVATFIMVPIAWLLMVQNDIMDIILAIIGLGVIGYLLFVIAPKYEKQQQQKIWVVVTLLVFTTIFWTFFELAGSALNLFTARNINLSFLGMDLEAGYFQSVNPFFIMIFAPVFSWLWIKLAKADKEPAAPYKFGVGLILLGLGFIVLNMGSGAAQAGLVPAFFLIMLYLLHTLGELTLSPVGLSLVTKLAPVKIVGFLMGIWFLSSSIAHQAGKHIAKYTSVDEAAIVTGDSFQGCMQDEVVKLALKEEKFQNYLSDYSRVKKESENPCTPLKSDEINYKLCNEGQSLESTLVNDQFLAYLNEKAGSTTYYAGKVQNKEAKEAAEKIEDAEEKQKALDASITTFLTTNAQHANMQILPKAEANSLVEGSLQGQVITCLKNDSLSLGLSVFRMLGLIAIGCGIFLFLLGPIISRWMHGIK